MANASGRQEIAPAGQEPSQAPPAPGAIVTLEPAEKGIWPDPSPNQWYWHEARTDLGWTRAEGVLVVNVAIGGPVDRRAGVQSLDVILEDDGGGGRCADGETRRQAPSGCFAAGPATLRGVVCRCPGSRALATAGVVVALALSGCESGGPRARAESAALKRQAETLRHLIAAVETGEAFSSRHVTLGIGQELVRGLLQLTLPVETRTAPDLHVRLETAEVAFDNGESRVTLRGRVSRASSPGTFADLVVHGGLHRFEVGEPAGQVTARVALDRLEVRRAEAEGLRRDLVEGVLERLGEPSLAALAEQIPPLSIPVRFERALETGAVRAGPFTIPPGSVRLRVELARVVALRGRLWVLLDVSAAPGGARAARAAEARP